MEQSPFDYRHTNRKTQCKSDRPVSILSVDLAANTVTVLLTWGALRLPDICIANYYANRTARSSSSLWRNAVSWRFASSMTA